VIVPMKPFHLSKNNLFHFIVLYFIFMLRILKYLAIQIFY